MPGRKFDPARKAHLDDPRRAKYLNPESIAEHLKIVRGMKVADIGAGTGAFAIPMAEKVWRTGTVYACDISQEMLDAITGKLYGINNVELVLTEENKIPLPDGAIDLALMVNVLHELEGDGTLKEVLRILRSGGRLAIADWRKRPMLEGPPIWHKISEDRAVDRIMALGFEFNDWFEPGPYHYGLIFSKKK